MALRNRHGIPVDPVPVLVVVGLAFMLFFSFGPLYGMALGVSLPAALAASTAGFLAASALAFYWQVWDAHPSASTPTGLRAEQLFYLMVALAVAVIGLSIPLLV